MIKRILLVISVFAFLLAACGSAVATPDTMMDQGGDMMTADSYSGDGMMDNSNDSMMDVTPTQDATNDNMNGSMSDTPAWFGVTFTDANTGQTFSIDSLKGKVVLVETMAQWCTNCKQQQGQVVKLHEMLGQRDDFVSFGLGLGK